MIVLFMVFYSLFAKKIHIFLQQTPWEKKTEKTRPTGPETFGNHPQPPREQGRRKV